MVPVTTRLLSPEQYGISSLITTVTSFMFVLCCLGMEQGFVRFFYDEKEENRGDLLYKCLYYPFFISVVLYIFIFIFRNKISVFFLGKENSCIWLILLLSIFFTTLQNFSLLGIRMKQRGTMYSFCNVMLKAIEFLLIIILYRKYGDSYQTLVLAVLGALIVTTLFSLYLEKDLWKFKGNSKTTKKELFYFCAPLTLTMAMTWIFGSSDKIAIKILADLTELGLYTGAFKIVALLSVVQSGFTNFWTPVVYEHYSKNPEDLEFYKKANDYLSFIFFILGIGILLSRNLIILLLGQKYYSSIFIMPMLIFVPIMYLISETTFMGIAFKKKTKYFLYITFFVAVANIFGNILLIPKFGAKGAAISTGISYILFFYLRTYFSVKLVNFGFNLKRIYLAIFLMMIYAVYLSFNNNILLDIMIGIILETIVCLLYLSEIRFLMSQYILKYTKQWLNNK